MAFGKRIATFVVAGTMMLGTLVGCGGNQQQAGGDAQPAQPAAYTSAKEVIDAFQANKDSKNCHMVMDMSMTMKAAEMELPITVKSDMDVVNDNTHGTMDMNMMGQDVKVEMYAVKEGSKYTTYTGSDLGGEKTWTKGEAETNPTSGVADFGDIDKAEFEATDTGYKITLPGDQIANTLTSASGGQDMFANMDPSVAEAFKKSLANSKIVYNFDKDCLLQDMSFDGNFDLSQGSGEDAQAASMTLSLKATFSNYGKIDPKVVEVPADVVANATDAEQQLNAVAEEVDAAAAEAEGATTTTEKTADAA